MPIRLVFDAASEGKQFLIVGTKKKAADSVGNVGSFHMFCLEFLGLKVGASKPQFFLGISMYSLSEPAR